MTSHEFQPGPLADVEAQQDGDRWTLVFVRTLPHPPAKVWAALTEPDQLRAWAPFVPDRDLGRTGPAILTMIDGETDMELPPATVNRADPPALLEYTWGGDLLRWELATDGDGTRLTLRHTVADAQLVSKVAAGWHLCLVVADRLLAGSPIPPIRGQQAVEYGHAELEKEYTERLGDSGWSPA
jgi:uncharacterized protein YndB with AHSA1/START domain